MKIADCAYGQVTKTLPDSYLSYCVSCAPGTYSLDPNGICLVCPIGADCSAGILNINIGYWRLKNNILPCVPFSFSCR